MEKDHIDEFIESAKSEWPAVFALSEIDRLTGNAVRRGTVHNLRSRREIPTDIFCMSGKRKVLVLRDRFLDWWSNQLKPAA